MVNQRKSANLHSINGKGVPVLIKHFHFCQLLCIIDQKWNIIVMLICTSLIMTEVGHVSKFHKAFGFLFFFSFVFQCYSSILFRR